MVESARDQEIAPRRKWLVDLLQCGMMELQVVEARVAETQDEGCTTNAEATRMCKAYRMYSDGDLKNRSMLRWMGNSERFGFKMWHVPINSEASAELISRQGNTRLARSV